ncbi:DUF2868 domain-containing protein [Desulforhopalus sp. IMCC35007]|uniref:DUF2868 domain-containing protein n=1 Tax=Desulforhopalus sp. IMCC35007 TaxID=2569543 RepID=UPI0010AE9B59|nr:DUF2868 domain-containing protein [Desulforhopalus sp. IMCC35007]TKB05877.1 DUF2868 domain-containing protein [Desulforhopalus sp. IMCC35007]
MKTLYSLGNIIDLEYFLHKDTNISPEKLHLRDREIALSLVEQESDHELTTVELLSGWLGVRLKSEFVHGQSESPGTIFTKSRALASSLVSIKGLFAGLFAGWAFFAYAGTTPVNVLQFLLFFVFSQLLFALLLFGSIAFRKLISETGLPQTGYLLLHSLGKALFKRLHRKWLQSLGGDKRESIGAAYGIIRSRSKIYGSLFYWPIFSLAQLFGITFNIGLLTTSLIKIVTSDLAFGWQSTLQLSDIAMYKMVQFLALPWSWLFPQGLATPSISEIAGSHIVLKDGIYHLATGDLVAWWPFLLLCLVFYGLILRLIFYVSSRLLEGVSLQNLKWNTPKYAALLRRMRTPIVSTQAQDLPHELTDDSNPEPAIASSQTTSTAPPRILLIPDDICDSFPVKSLTQLMGQKGYTLTAQYRFMCGYEEDRQLLQTLSKNEFMDETGFYIIMEAWMVPLVDFLVFLKDIRKLSTPETIIEIALTGSPEGAHFTKIAATDFTIWSKKIQSIGDPYIHLSAITGITK